MNGDILAACAKQTAKWGTRSTKGNKPEESSPRPGKRLIVVDSDSESDGGKTVATAKRSRHSKGNPDVEEADELKRAARGRLKEKSRSAAGPGNKQASPPGDELQDNQPLSKYSVGDRALVHLVVDSKKPWQAQSSVAGPQEQKRLPSSTSAPLGIRSSKRRAEDESAGLVAQRREPKASHGASESNEPSSSHTPRRSNLSVADRNTSPAGRSLMTAARGSSDADAGAPARHGKEDVRGAGRRAVDGGVHRLF